MSHMQDLENITEHERKTLKDLLLERIDELNEKKKTCVSQKKLDEIEELLRVNTYFFHWLDNPTTNFLQ